MQQETVIGRRVKILGDHAHSGETGMVDRLERVIMGNVGLIIRLADCPHGTDECFVFRPEHLQLIDEEE